MVAFLVASYGQAFEQSRQSFGFQSLGLRSIDTELKTNIDGRRLTIGDQLLLSGRRQTFLAFVYAAARLYEAQLSSGSQGVMRKEAFIGLIGSTGTGDIPFASPDCLHTACKNCKTCVSQAFFDSFEHTYFTETG